MRLRKRPALLLAKLCVVAVACIGSAAATAAPTSSTAVPNITGVWRQYPPLDPGPTTPFPPPPVPPLKEPYASAHQAESKRLADAEARGQALATNSSKCRNEGMPDMMAPVVYALEILQTPGQITVLAEFLGQTRRIYLNESLPPLEELTPSYNGYSVGQWKGSELHVETIGVREDVLYLNLYAGVPHSARMKISERIHLTGPDLLRDDITIEDPDFLAKPFKYSQQYQRQDKSYKIMEYVCDNENSVLQNDGTIRFETPPQPGASRSKAP